MLAYLRRKGGPARTAAELQRVAATTGDERTAIAAFRTGAKPAVVAMRGDLVESEHFVSYAAVDADGRVLAAVGDVDAPIYMRSSAKPLIAAEVVASGAARRFGFSEEELALIGASHSGEARHVAGVRSILRKAGVDESALRCGVHPPVTARAVEEIARAGGPTQIHNNCSGKHAGIIALGLALGAGADGYLEPSHPAQQAIARAYAAFFDVAQSELRYATDGCGIPVVALGLRTAARCFARFARPESFPAPYGAALERVVRAMVAHPFMVAGTGRFDTDFMTALRPRIACKGGAEGYHATAVLDRAVGLCAKVADGNFRATAPFVLSTLRRLDLLGDDEVERLASHAHPTVKNHAGRPVGEIRAV